MTDRKPLIVLELFRIVREWNEVAIVAGQPQVVLMVELIDQDGEQLIMTRAEFEAEFEVFARLDDEREEPPHDPA